MTDAASAAIAALTRAIQEIPPERAKRQRVTRQLLDADPLERVVPAKLLTEAAGKLLETRSPTRVPHVLFMDRAGGGDGARAAMELMPLLRSRWSGVAFVHISFATPAQGLGTLVRGMLVRAGAENGVHVQVLAHSVPAEGMRLCSTEADEITDAFDLVVTFAPGGAAGLQSDDQQKREDRLLKRSHLSVLSFPDPESTVAALPTFTRIIAKEPDLQAIRFHVQVESNHVFEDLGIATLGPGGDAEDHLWALVDNARRHRYRILAVPLGSEHPLGDPLVFPCRAVIETELGSIATVPRIVPAGSRLVAVALARRTLI